MKLVPHPRLYIGTRELERLARRPDTPLLRQATRRVAALAAEAVASPVFEWERNTHNAHLLRARRMQGRIVALLAEWRRTGDDRFRRAAVEHVAEMGRWEYWSWITWREGNPDPGAIFDLSYGENSTTLAFAWDLLHGTLSESERALFLDIARRRALGPCAALNLDREKPLWWWTHYNCNWLTVCGGGAGLLCLAMYEELPEARRLLPRLDRQLLGYMKHVEACDGGWNEGVGYWNYGMRYGYMYWLSHERATGRAHPALRTRAAHRTLWFPAEFSPNNIGTGFGDIPVAWAPEPFHYAAAARYRDAALVEAMDGILARRGFGDRALWPNAAEYLLFRSRNGEMAAWKAAPARRKGPVARLYPGMEWGYLADRMPSPRLYLSLRGGSTDVPHAHLDVLSVQVVVGDEAMLAPAPASAYIDTTFSNRKFEVFEKGWFGKNTIIVGGVGLSNPASATTAPLKLPGAVGYRLDAPGAIRINYQGEQVETLVRVILMLKGRAFLVLDRVRLKGTNLIESRFCSPARVALEGGASAALQGKRSSARLTFAATVPCLLVTAQTIPTRPQTPPSTLVRWCTSGLERDAVLATLITPGRGKAALEVTQRGEGFAIGVRGSGLMAKLRFTDTLRPTGAI